MPGSPLKSTLPLPGAGRVAGRLAAKLRTGIADGRIPAGEFLPTERELAAEHGLAVMTVRRALRSTDGHHRQLVLGGELPLSRKQFPGAERAAVDRRPKVSRQLSSDSSGLDRLQMTRLRTRHESLRELVVSHYTPIKAGCWGKITCL